MNVSQEVYNQKLSFLTKEALDELIYEYLDGAIIEAGCALGGSAIVIASTKKKETPFFIYDTFKMIPPPTKKDGPAVRKFYDNMYAGKALGIRGSKYYAYHNNLYEEVKTNFANFNLVPDQNNINMIKGDICETMHIDFPISFAHIDCDWYDSVKVCMQQIWPNLVLGGIMVIDDYYTWSGCTLAVNEYLKDRKDYRFVKKKRLHITKVGK